MTSETIQIVDKLKQLNFHASYAISGLKNLDITSADEFHARHNINWALNNLSTRLEELNIETQKLLNELK